MEFRSRLLPTWAILKHDLGTLTSSWLMRIWFVVSGLIVFLMLASQWPMSDDRTLIGWLMFPYLVFPWFLVVMMLGVGPVAGGRAESLSDGILSRPVTRYEYLLASWAARGIAVLGVFLVAVVPAILLVMLADRNVPDHPATSYGVLASLFVVCLVLTLQVSLAFLLGTVLRRQMVAVAVLVMAWLVSAVTLDSFRLEELSPISLCQAVPTLLEQPWVETDEPEVAKEISDFSQIFKPLMDFGGATAKAKSEEKFLESEDFEDVALWRVTLGYGIPTLLSIALATLVFCRRDL